MFGGGGGGREIDGVKSGRSRARNVAQFGGH